MAKLLPTIDIETVEPRSERQVLTKLLKDLPDKSILLHSYETLSREKRGNSRRIAKLIEGECDVVILWPDKGMLVIEVKGGGVAYDPATARWTSKDRYGTINPIKDPFEQARKNMHVLEKRVAAQIGVPVAQLGLTRGYAVVLPSNRIDGELPTHVDIDILCDATGLPTIRKFVERALSLWARDSSRKLESVPFAKIAKALIPSMNLLPSLSARIDSESSTLHRLTKEQAMLLEFVGSQPRARIKGVAGSGKTLLAVQQAERFAAQDLNTLLLCYNRSLAQWLRAATKDSSDKFTIMTFHELCEEVTTKAGGTFNAPQNADDANTFWKDQTPELLMDHFAGSGISYDALVIDEGQDFQDSWWLALESIFATDAPVYAFYDNNQNLFNANGKAALDEWLPLRFDLPTNCRNTQAIADYCANIVSIDSKANVNAPQGTAVTSEVSSSEVKRRELVEKLLTSWLSDEKLPPQKIAILSPRRIDKSSLAAVGKVAGIALTSNVADWQAGKGVLITTIRSFKGLEADALIMVDIPQPGSQKVFSEADFYVGCSRAKSVLHLIASEPLGTQYPLAA